MPSKASRSVISVTGRVTVAGVTHVPLRDHPHRSHRTDLGGAVELVHRAGHLDEIANGDVDAEGAVEHEDAFRGQWIAVGLGVFLLQVEAAERSGALEVTDHNRLHDHSGTVEGAGGAGALDLVDQTRHWVRWRHLAHVGHADGRDELRIGLGVPGAAAAIRAALVGLGVPGTRLVLVHLWLAGIEEGQQTGIVGVGRVVDQGVNQVIGADRAPVGEIGRIAGVQGHRVLAVLD